MNIHLDSIATKMNIIKIDIKYLDCTITIIQKFRYVKPIDQTFSKKSSSFLFFFAG